MIHWGDSFASDATVLQLFTPAGEERRISLVGRRELKIGSSRESDLVLDGPEVAAEHCRIYEREGRLILIDRGSPAGTQVNEHRVIQPTALREGDRIAIGLHLLQVLPGRAHLGTEVIADQMAREPPRWVADDAAIQHQFIQLLEQRAAAWEAHRRPARLLLTGESLERAVVLAVRPTTLIPWLDASITHHRRRQGLRWLATGLVPGALCGALLAAPVLFQPAPVTAAVTAAPSPPASKSPPATASRCTSLTHTVIPLETVDEVAARYDVDARRVAADDDLSPGGPLQPGMNLTVCSHRTPTRRDHIRDKPRDGDTWESLARRHGLSPDRLRQYNPHLGQFLTSDDLVELWKDAAAPPAVRDYATPETPPGASPAGKPNDGTLENGAMIRATDFFDVRCERNTFASSHTMAHLHRGLLRLREVYNYQGQIVVGDASRKDGGGYGPHLSHQSGRDVDVWLPIKGGAYPTGRKKVCGTPWRRPEPAEVDWDAAYQLVRGLHDTTAVQHIFLDRLYHSALRAAAERAGLAPIDIDRLVQPKPGLPAVVTHSDNHRHHIHVRFRCGPDDTNCRS